MLGFPLPHEEPVVLALSFADLDPGVRVEVWTLHKMA